MLSPLASDSRRGGASRSAGDRGGEWSYVLILLGRNLEPQKSAVQKSDSVLTGNGNEKGPLTSRQTGLRCVKTLVVRGW